MSNEIWKPFKGSPQEFVLTIPPGKAFEILFGGARGPGKTDAGIVWLMEYIKHPLFRALVLRKNYDDLVDWIDRARHMYRKYNAEVTGQPKEVRWPSGAKFRLGHLKDESYEKYLGHEYPRILIEELTQIAKESSYIKIMGSCRSTIKELAPQMFNTTNPGGVGHGWVKRRFVDPSPPNKVFSTGGSRPRVYVPATVDDNPILKEIDPGYIEYLDSLKETDYELWKAWRLGDWDVFSGQFFREFRKDLHTTQPFQPLDSLSKYGGVDWGYSPRPFVFIAGAMEKISLPDIPTFNRLWIYRMLRGTDTTPQKWSSRIKDMLDLNQFEWIRGDPSMNIKQSDGSRSILDQFRESDVTILPANNDRINGWQALRNWLSIAPDGLPYLIISEQCYELIVNLPDLVHDENKTDDLDTEGLDDEADALRYMIIHLKWIDAKVGTASRPRPKILPPKYVGMLDLKKFK